MLLNLLLDTHVVVWLGENDRRLTDAVRTALVEAEEVFVSFASAWEYGHKRLARPGSLDHPFDKYLRAEFRLLACEFQLARYAERLPLIHGDPFDRMLVAQALDCDLTLVTSDAKIRAYPGVKTLW